MPVPRLVPNEPVFCIAEIGVNHNGDVVLAKELIDAAAHCGADAVKFQTFRADEIAAPGTPLADYQKKNTGSRQDQRELLRRLELSERAHFELSEYAGSRNVLFFSTPHSGKWDVDLLERVGVEIYKIGSADLTNWPLLVDVARTRKPVLLSTGMATLQEAKEGVDLLQANGAAHVVVLQCTTEYPCPPEEVNLGAMTTLAQACRTAAGYSDHTRGTEAAVLAARMGAVCVEKHFTIDRNLRGPDHAASMEPEEFRELVRWIRSERAGGPAYRLSAETEKVLRGSSEKEPSERERKTALLVRKSVAAREQLQAGVRLEAGHLCVRRPGTGISPKDFSRILGRTLLRDIPENRLLSWEDLQ